MKGNAALSATSGIGKKTLVWEDSSKPWEGIRREKIVTKKQ